MKAIETKYLPATNFKGSRIKAFTEGGNSLTIGYPHELSGHHCHALAAFKLCDKMGWNAENGVGSTSESMTWGGTKGGYVFCFNASQVSRDDVKAPAGAYPNSE